MLDSWQQRGCGCDRSEPAADLMPVEAAVARALEQVAPIRETQPVPLAEADGLACVPGETACILPGDRLTWQPFAREGMG